MRPMDFTPVPSAVNAPAVAFGPRPVESAWTAALNVDEAEQVHRHWPFWATKAQLPPSGGWSKWLLLGGRGSGKTRAGAEVVRALVACGEARRIALIAPTLHDARSVMVEGPSGLLAVDPTASFQPSLRVVQWPNGAEAHLFGAAEPERLRGPQFDCAWGDEVCYWQNGLSVLSTLRLGLRLGAHPRSIFTSTPRAGATLMALLATPGLEVTRAPTRDNIANLAPRFLHDAESAIGAGDSARQELEGVAIERTSGALWSAATLQACRVDRAPALDRIVVAVDPPASSGPNSDACGIVAAGRRGGARDGVAFVLADASVTACPPHVWARAAVELYQDLGAACIVAEANMGGDMVHAVLAAADARAPVRLVRASRSKRARAAPISALYGRGRVFHVGRFSALEAEMLSFHSDDANGSPDRVDALVWALTDLFHDGAEPSLRAI